MVVFNPVNGVAMSALGYYMPWYLLGGMLVIVGGVLLKITKLSTSVAQIYGALVVGGIGTGVFSQASFSVAQSLVPVKEIPTGCRVHYLRAGRRLGYRPGRGEHGLSEPRDYQDHGPASD
jgi:hypothetical protein